MTKSKTKWFPVEQRGSSKDFPLMPATLTLYRITTSSAFKKATGIKWRAGFILDMGLNAMKNYVREDQWNDVCNKCYIKVKKNPFFQKKLIKEFVKRTPNFLAFCKHIYKSDLKQKDNKKLFELYEKYIRLYEDIYIWGEPFAFAARFQLSDYLSGYLKNILAKRNESEKFDEYFSTLITPPQKPFITEEKEELLKIALQIKNNELKTLFKKNLKFITKEIKRYPNIDQKIDKHTEQYQWISYNYGSDLLTKNYFLKELKTIIEKNSAEAELNKIERIYSGLKNKQNKIIKELKIDKYHQKLFDALRWNSFIIDYKKKVFTLSHFYINFSLMKEIARRLKIKQSLAHCLLETETKKALLQNKLVPQKILDQRYKRSVVFVENGRTVLLVGEKAEQFLKKQGIVQEKLKSFKEIKGQIANVGIITGKAKIVTGPKDFSKIKKGEILVTHMTTPEFIPILKKAIAIVTDEGGITCHAAIVARELNIPCIISTKIATKVLNDNDFVEVDANKGVIKILKR
jgi:phosphohistidine swiveling domain-containing protein